MIEGENFLIGHIPKTGGHALILMLLNAGIIIKHPFKRRKENKLFDGFNKHQTFENINTKKDLLLVIRRLPNWWLSYMWHQSKIVTINYKLRVEKKIIGHDASYENANNRGFLFLPEQMAYTVYPDYILNLYKKSWDIKWLRMENLSKDISVYLNRKIENVLKTNTSNPPTEYWTKNSLETLYKNNPEWTKLEQEIYETILQ